MMATRYLLALLIVFVAFSADAAERPQGVRPGEKYWGSGADPKIRRWCDSWHGKLQIGAVVDGKVALGAGIHGPDGSIWHDTFCQLPDGTWAYPGKMGPY